jgi:DNA-binding IclR family transcriptional regulator
VAAEQTAREGSTTVDRSVRLLFELARNPEGLTVSELARRLDTQRPPLYRQLRTLTEARLIRRTEGKLYRLGVGVLELARAFSDPITERARPALQVAADASGYSAMLNLAEDDALVMVLCATPRTPGMHLTTPTGFLYPEGLIPPRVAMLAARPAADGEAPVVTEARERGYTGTATLGSRYGIIGVAVPLRSRGINGSVALVTGAGSEPLSAEDERELAKVAQRAVEEIADSGL